MAFKGFIDGYTRPALQDIVLYEVSSPNGWSRKVISAPKASYEVGDVVDEAGTIIAAGQEENAFGVVITRWDNNEEITTQGGMLQPTMIFRDAEIKRSALKIGEGADRAKVLKALAARGIDTILDKEVA
ncbi:hypothetical protein LPLM1_00036 [Listeria phage LPML1]|nr:hypothetical protein LPLM1_00036 [Listeria phage LPML1]